jgi:oxygen-dependent protoporphyrinogen oxidase
MKVAVVGGGVSGLTAARELAVAGAEVAVLEATSRCGGKLDSLLLDGVRLDCGAESLLARRPEAVGLVAELGLGTAMVYPTGATPRVLADGQLRAIPPQSMGVPVDLDMLSGLLSPGGLARAREEPALPAPPLEGDVAIGRYVEERFGPEVTDRLLEPLLGGVYAGHARELSFEAVHPRLFERASSGGSLLSHARAAASGGSGEPVFAGLVGGVGTLVPALLDDLRMRNVEVRTGATVTSVEPRYRGGYLLVLGGSGGTLQVDGVVVAAPAGASARLLAQLAPKPAEAFASIPYASMAVVTLVVRGVSVDGSGVLVPPGELPTVKALTYSSNKWQWVADQASAVWGDGTAVVRASVGRFGETQALQVDDESLLRRTLWECQRLEGWQQANLLTGQVRRWGGALPQYRVGHGGLVAAARERLASVTGVEVCGAALEGVGIAACIGTAQSAARALLETLGADGGPTTKSRRQTPHHGRNAE